MNEYQSFFFEMDGVTLERTRKHKYTNTNTQIHKFCGKMREICVNAGKFV
jgi:hypothetical protein